MIKTSKIIHWRGINVPTSFLLHTFSLFLEGIILNFLNNFPCLFIPNKFCFRESNEESQNKNVGLKDGEKPLKSENNEEKKEETEVGDDLDFNSQDLDDILDDDSHSSNIQKQGKDNSDNKESSDTINEVYSQDAFTQRKNEMKSPKNAYESMNQSVKKLKMVKNFKSIEEMNIYNEIENLDKNSDEEEEDENDKSLIKIFKKVSKDTKAIHKNNREEIKTYENPENKQRFVRYFKTPTKTETVENEWINYNVWTQGENINIGDNIEEFLSDDDFDLDLGNSQDIPQSQIDAIMEDETEHKEIITVSSILKSFPGVKLFDWQRECLQLKDVVHKRASLIYSAPTSAGKSLVSEVLMIKNAVTYKDKLVLIIFPFISLINEKEK